MLSTKNVGEGSTKCHRWPLYIHLFKDRSEGLVRHYLTVMLNDMSL